MEAYVLLMKLVVLIISWFVWDWLIDWVFMRVEMWLDRGSGSDDCDGGGS